MRALPPAQSISILLLSLTASFLSSARPAGAATFAVTRGDDPSPGPCNAGDCSLREAVMAANAAPGSTITLPAGTYTLTIPGWTTWPPTRAIGDLDIFVATTLTGAGAGNHLRSVRCDPLGGIHRVFDNHPGGSTTISGMTIRNGFDVENESGGCVRNTGVLTIDSVVVSGCGSRVGGGGLASYNTLAIYTSTITGNQVNSPTGATVSGGGVAGGPGGRRSRDHLQHGHQQQHRQQCRERAPHRPRRRLRQHRDHEHQLQHDHRECGAQLRRRHQHGEHVDRAQHGQQQHGTVRRRWDRQRRHDDRSTTARSRATCPASTAPVRSAACPTPAGC